MGCTSRADVPNSADFGEDALSYADPDISEVADTDGSMLREAWII